MLPPRLPPFSLFLPRLSEEHASQICPPLQRHVSFYSLLSTELTPSDCGFLFLIRVPVPPSTFSPPHPHHLSSFLLGYQRGSHLLTQPSLPTLHSSPRFSAPLFPLRGPPRTRPPQPFLSPLPTLGTRGPGFAHQPRPRLLRARGSPGLRASSRSRSARRMNNLVAGRAAPEPDSRGP